MDARASKPVIRAEVIARTLALDPGVRLDEQAALEERFETLPGLSQAGTVLLYASAFPEEVETGPFLRRVLEADQRLVLPIVDRRLGSLRLAEVLDPSRDLIASRRGIPEPRQGLRPVGPGEVDWILVPGLAFDAEARRLGRGAGHYDRLLPRLRPEVHRWALIFSTQWVDSLPVEPHDQPLDGVVSAHRMVLHGPGKRLNR